MPTDDRMGVKLHAGHLTSRFDDAQEKGEIQPSHGSRGIRAFDPTRFICLLDGVPGHKHADR